MVTQVRLDGAKAFRKQLKAAGVDLKDLREPHKKAADLVVRVAKPRTPKRTGRLAASVRGSGTVTAGTVRAGKQSVPYANPIHWGWPARNIKPNPWLVSTAHATEPQWLPEFVSEMERVMNELSKDYTRRP